MFSNSNRYRLSADSFAPGTLSHQLYVYCSIPGKPSGKAKIRKTVNYYRFKEFVETTLNEGDFNWWYFANKNSVIFLAALTTYLNAKENRTAIYYVPSPGEALLNRLLTEVTTMNKKLEAALAV